MHFVLSSGAANVQAGFGAGGPLAGPGAALQAFRPVLEAIGPVTVAHDQRAALRIMRWLGLRAQPCLHLCFALPHELPHRIVGPTIPVFGWGLATMPDEAWDGVAEQDWRVNLARAGRAICFSQSAAASVRRLMGPQFAVCVLAPPMAPCAAASSQSPKTLALTEAAVLDTADWPEARPPVLAFSEEDDLADAASATPSEAVLFKAVTEKPWRKTWRYRLGVTRKHGVEWYREAVRDLLPKPAARAASTAAQLGLRAIRAAAPRARRRQEFGPANETATADDAGATDSLAWVKSTKTLALDGLVFSAVHGVWDRSWSDVISAFVWAFRDAPEAELVVLSHKLDQNAREGLATFLRRLRPFACRIVLLDADLDDAARQAWIEATSFFVSASHAEAAPMPMMRFMAAGTPVLAPVHSALADFVGPDCAIIVASQPEHDYWPHDPREKLHSASHRIDWESLCAGYRAARAAAADPELYGAMSQAARARMAGLCAQELIGDRLRAFLDSAPPNDPDFGKKTAA